MKFIKYILALFLSFSSHAQQLQGVLDWGETVKLGFPVTGVVQDVHVNAGDRVKSGQVLVSLDQQPFNAAVQKCKARLERIQPSIFDAKLELDRAEELFERTVLSEVELQRIDGDYKELLAEENMIKADQQQMKWKLAKSKLISP